VRHLLLDHADGDLDQRDRLLEADRAGERARRGIEDLVGDLLRVAGIRPAPAQPLHQRPHAGLSHQHDPGALIRRQLAEPGQGVVHPCHAGGRQPAGRPLDLA
jgi:hypothetical protein